MSDTNKKIFKLQERIKELRVDFKYYEEKCEETEDSILDLQDEIDELIESED